MTPLYACCDENQGACILSTGNLDKVKVMGLISEVTVTPTNEAFFCLWLTTQSRVVSLFLII